MEKELDRQLSFISRQSGEHAVYLRNKITERLRTMENNLIQEIKKPKSIYFSDVKNYVNKERQKNTRLLIALDTDASDRFRIIKRLIVVSFAINTTMLLGLIIAVCYFLH